MKRLLPRTGATAFLAALLGVPSAQAGPSANELDNIFAFKGLVYRQEDGGGNPDVDEDASVYEGLLLVKHNINAQNALNLRLLGDVITAASYDEAADRAETVSGATGYNPGRFEIRPGWAYRRSGWSVATHISYGQEFAYRSRGAGMTLSKTLAEGSTVLAARLQGYSDKVRMIRFDGTKEPDEERETLTGEISLTQTLSPTRVMNASYSYTDQDGFLATSFNAVRVADRQDFEILPRQREREALGLRFKQAFGPHSIETAYRYYFDDWNINAHTLEINYFHWLAGPRVRLQPSYRYYHQDASRYFARHFAQAQEFQTSDSDLGEFSGQKVGLQALFTQRSWPASNTDYDIGLHYYHRDDDIDMLWLMFGISFPY